VNPNDGKDHCLYLTSYQCLYCQQATEDEAFNRLMEEHYEAMKALKSNWLGTIKEGDSRGGVA
jgi:hypothetical protein